MGVALDHLSEARRIEIAEGLFKVTKRDSSKGELHGLCPIHGEKNPSLSYNYKSDLYHCLSCGAKGDLAGLWVEVKGFDPREGFKEFCQAHGIEVKGEAKSSPRRRPGGQKAADKVIAETEWQKLKPLPEPWIKRLEKKRAWSPETIQTLDLRLWESRGEQRIAIPVRNEKSELVNIRLYLPGATENKVRSWKQGYGKSRLWCKPPLVSATQK